MHRKKSGMTRQERRGIGERWGLIIISNILIFAQRRFFILLMELKLILNFGGGPYLTQMLLLWSFPFQGMKLGVLCSFNCHRFIGDKYRIHSDSWFFEIHY